MRKDIESQGSLILSEVHSLLLAVKNARDTREANLKASSFVDIEVRVDRSCEVGADRT